MGAALPKPTTQQKSISYPFPSCHSSFLVSSVHRKIARLEPSRTMPSGHEQATSQSAGQNRFCGENSNSHAAFPKDKDRRAIKLTDQPSNRCSSLSRETQQNLRRSRETCKVSKYNREHVWRSRRRSMRSDSPKRPSL